MNTHWREVLRAVSVSNQFPPIHVKVFFSLYTFLVVFFFFVYCFSNASFPAPQIGQTQSSGRFSNAVPAAIPASGSPFAGSYTYPQTVQTYLSIFISSFFFSVFLSMLLS